MNVRTLHVPRWRDLPASWKGAVVVALPLATLIFAVGVFFVVDDRNRTADNQVLQTVEVQAHLAQVLSLALDAETAGRGWLITGDERYIEPLVSARGRVNTEIAQLRSLVVDQQVVDLVDELADLVAQRLVISEQVVALEAPRLVDAGEIPALLDEGKEVTDRIREVAGVIALLEEDLLAERRQQAETAQFRGRVSVIVALLIGLAGGGLATLLYSRGIARRLAELKHDVDSMADGSPPASAANGRDEIGALAAGFHAARAQLVERERELRESQAQLQALIDASPDVIMVLDRHGTIRSPSPSIERVLGYPAAERVGQSLRDVVHPDDDERFHEALMEVTSGRDRDLVLRCRVRHAGGTWRHLEIRGRALRGESAAEVVVVGRDVDAQVELEWAQSRAVEAAELANRSKSEFLSRMSHELRTPLNAVLGFAQLLGMDDLGADQRDSVEQILKAGRHLLELINEVLDISRIEAGEMALSPEPVQLREVLQDAIDLVRPLAEDHDVAMDADPLGSCDGYVLADRQRTLQVILNLLSNAIKYNRHPGTVSVRCRTDGGRFILEVSDTGHGIRPEQRSILFTPFERLEAAGSGIDGTGIGLSLSRRLCEAMRGTLELTRSTESGSTFSLTLPRAEAPEQRHERLGPPVVVAVTDDVTDVPFRIVHIEDNLSNLRLIERVLGARRHLRIIPAMQGRLGLDLVREHQPDLVLLDLHLPDVMGDDVLRQLVDDPATASIPVVMLSADATQGQIQRLLAVGAYAYLTKPVDVRQLIATIDAIVDAEPDLRHR